jgi:hypothetical protein
MEHSTVILSGAHCQLLSVEYRSVNVMRMNSIHWLHNNTIIHRLCCTTSEVLVVTISSGGCADKRITTVSTDTGHNCEHSTAADVLFHWNPSWTVLKPRKSQCHQINNRLNTAVLIFWNQIHRKWSTTSDSMVCNIGVWLYSWINEWG